MFKYGTVYESYNASKRTLRIKKQNHFDLIMRDPISMLFNSGKFCGASCTVYLYNTYGNVVGCHDCRNLGDWIDF